ncbi:MAG: hypothetical protein QM770_13155 [Tepidisphaeraceae bacterium]
MSRFASIACVGLAVLSLSSVALAAPARSEDAPPLEARELGYGQEVAMKEPGGAAGSYFLLVGVSLLAIGVMFKNAARTHLD